jgi:hypothetical protein
MHAGPVAVAVGSRGIANLLPIVRAVGDVLREFGAQPFVVPAMGSHGGGTAAGQVAILAAYGITEAALNVPIRATMETCVIGSLDGIPVHVDRNVIDVGQAFLVSRVKPHTDFTGPIESGPTKMAAIGLGKLAGARDIHARGALGLRDLMPRVGRYIVIHHVVGALAIIENDRKQAVQICGLRPDEIGGAREVALLDTARSLLPGLPFTDLDVLIVERLGKDLSGAGMDPNVTGRWGVTGLEEPPHSVRCIVALDLTPASEGNAIGLGLADIIPAKLLGKVDLLSVYTNALTAGWSGLRRAHIPIVVPTDRDAIMTAIALFGTAPQRPLRLIWLTDTSNTSTIAVSEALAREVPSEMDLEIEQAAQIIPFTADGHLLPLSDLHAGRRFNHMG